MFPEVPVETLCGMFGKSRQAYYDGEKRERTAAVEAEIILAHVRDCRKFLIAEGGKKLYARLKPLFESEGIKIGRDKFFDILREGNMLRKKKKHGKRTTNSNHPFFKYPNLIKELQITESERVWVCDITYLQYKQSFAYLSLITDSYSHKIMGWALSADLKTEGSLKALSMALATRSYPERELIHHSDKGIQYCSHLYTGTLKARGIAISMAEAGNPYENAIAERVNGILKQEFSLDATGCKTIEDLERIVGQAIWLYNSRRLHMSCEYLTPDQAHSRSGILKKIWEKQNV